MVRARTLTTKTFVNKEEAPGGRALGTPWGTECMGPARGGAPPGARICLARPQGGDGVPQGWGCNVNILYYDLVGVTGTTNLPSLSSE